VPLHPFEPPRGSLETLVIDSRALAGNLLGDPARRRVPVYSPPAAHGGARYPLIVFLAPFTGSGPKYLNWRGFGESVPQRLDRLVESGRMGPVVAAFPDGFTSLGGNQYVDSPVTGNWATFLLDEMLPQIEARFPVLPGPAHRAVIGRSSGGYGALVQALRHGARWRAAACHSGDIGFDLAYRRDLPVLADVLAAHGRDIPRFLAHARAAPRLRPEERLALMLLALAGSYDPDPGSPLGLRPPLDLETAEIDPRRWARWLAHDPLSLVEQPECRRGLAALRGLFVDCGTRDPYFLHYGARDFARRVAAHGLSCVYEEFEDGHSEIEYRLDVSLPRLYGWFRE
jgi:hypothetical protein